MPKCLLTEDEIQLIIALRANAERKIDEDGFAVIYLNKEKFLKVMSIQTSRMKTTFEMLAIKGLYYPECGEMFGVAGNIKMID